MIEKVKANLKKIKPIYALVKALKKTRRSILIDPMEHLYSHYPHSAGDQKYLSRIALNSTLSFESSLSTLVLKVNKLSHHNIIKAEALITKRCERSMASRIGEMLEKLGSDKSTKNNYHLIYGYIFANNNIRSLIEVGLGSNNEKIPSNMGAHGVPGASIRAFSKFVSERIVGLDYDKSILFQDGKISTYYVDQLRIETFEDLPNFDDFDLAIDDGLHVQNANVNTLSYFTDKISEDGIIVIEDIPFRALNSWIIIKEILDKKYSIKIIECKKSFAILIENKDGQSNKTIPK